MRPVDEILNRAAREIADGRPWRAKEILRGALATRAEPALLEHYGRLLESLGERYEAGKYLFLSGVRVPEYAAAIALFMSRNAARREGDFVRLFPAAVRRVPFEQLPAPVQEELKSRRVSDSPVSATERIVPPVRYTFRDRFNMAAAFLITAFFLLALVLGLRQILRWVRRIVFD
jgi:hypothetical protein